MIYMNIVTTREDRMLAIIMCNLNLYAEFCAFIPPSTLLVVDLDEPGSMEHHDLDARRYFRLKLMG